MHVLQVVFRSLIQVTVHRHSLPEWAETSQSHLLALFMMNKFTEHSQDQSADG